MLGTMVATWLALQGGTPDTVAYPVAVYTPVLEHLLRHAPAPGGLPVVLNPAVYPGISGRVETSHPGEVLRRLVCAGHVQAICSPEREPCSLPPGKHVSVSLGEVIDLPTGARVKVLPDDGTPGVPLDKALAAIPESEAVPASAAVDVVLHTPCPAPPDADRCRVPDIAIYRYFLNRRPDGAYRVVTRWLTGGA